MNKLRGTLQVLRREGARASATAARRCCEDIAVLTGGKAGLRGPRDRRSRRIDLNDLGTAEEGRSIDKENTTIIEGAGKKADIQGRIAPDQARRSTSTTSDYDKEKLQERLAKLAGGVAQINVGAATEAEMKEKKARVEDALHATRAAVEEGILPGGGVALVRAAEVARSP